MKHGQGGDQMQQSQSLWASFFQRSSSGSNSNTNITKSPTASTSTSTSGCPVKGSLPAVTTPASIEEAAKHAQTPQPDQTIPLSTHRATSSIPKPSVDAPAPAHQPAEAKKWVYPSEQQFFNAMKKKGWDIPPGTELTIPQVVQIHNAVNERGWTEVLKWERIRETNYNGLQQQQQQQQQQQSEPRLVKFIGRPKDLSPRARLYSTLWLRNEPFDRHDWYVDRGEGTEIRRYVIDFYNGKENPNAAGNGLPSMYLDVRPALDDLDSAQDRFKMFFIDAFPGIAGWMGSSKSGLGFDNKHDGTRRNNPS